MDVREASIRRYAAQRWPDAKVVAVREFGVDDAGAPDGTEKGFGYGTPVRVTFDDGREVVFHTAGANAFGHDRRADRAAEMLLAYDTFDALPDHVAAIDVGGIASGGALRSLADVGEFYLVTEYAPGIVYAADLRRLEREGTTLERDHRRCRALADYLAALHRDPVEAAPAERAMRYRRAIRDLIGHGEGIFGIVDGYPDDIEPATAARVQAIEAACVGWRSRLRHCDHRLRRTHGDFHPFNLVFDDDDALRVLDAARGGVGDPADDVVCLALNYLFFALQRPASWRKGLRALWFEFWTRYLDQSGDRAVLDCAPPFVAWRALVLANPAWYPAASRDCRHGLLCLAERALSASHLDVAWADETLEGAGA